MTIESFLEGARRELHRLRRLGDSALAQISDMDFFEAPCPEANSAAVIVKHLSGNMHSRWGGFLTSDGEVRRDRDAEFMTTAADTRAQLERQWREGWDLLFDVLDSIEEADLDRIVRIRNEPHTVRQAILRQLVHYAQHVGQIIYVCKLKAGEHWKTLSIPRGGSADFAQRGGTYLLPRK